MRGQVNIPALRDIVADAAVNDYVYSEEFDVICDALPALLEAVEAAELHMRGQVEPADLRAALDRFDFGDAA